MNNWSADKPFNDLPPLRESTLPDFGSLSSQITEARVSLARLDQAIKLISNPRVFLNAIPIVEAQASSAIENIVTTNDTLFQNADVEVLPKDANTQAAMRNRDALHLAFEIVTKRPISTKLAKEVCSTILGHKVEIRTNSGTYIGSQQSRIYTPPVGEQLIERHLAAWEKFINSKLNIDPLVLMALSHYQFEAIHPFTDGNGRTGRIINLMLLVQLGLLKLPVLHLSRAINRTRSDYYKKLANVTAKGQWLEWVEYILQMVKESADLALNQVEEINSLKQEFPRRFTSEVFKLGLTADLLELIFEKPYCKIGHVVERCSVSRPTAAKWLEELEKLGALESLVLGRDKYFINHQMLEILER